MRRDTREVVAMMGGRGGDGWWGVVSGGKSLGARE